MASSSQKIELSRKAWHLNVLPRKPDLYIGGEANPYLRRWYVLSTPWFRIYLHNILRSDDDRALHDHPWNNVSIILKGEYTELPGEWGHGQVYGAGSIIFRKAETAHRLVVDAGTSMWTLFLTGRYRRKWGFHCPKGWIPYERFVKPGAPGEIGAGCDG